MRVSIVAFCFLLLACTSSTTAPTANGPVGDTALTSHTEATPGTGVSAIAGTSLGSVQLQNHVIAIESGEAGVRYSVESSAGEMIAESITRDELKLRFPGLFDAFETATARRTLDASLTPGTAAGPRLAE